MGLRVKEFTLATDRTRVSVGEPFEVELTCAWTPITEGGDETVRIFCENGDFGATPSGVSVHVEPLGGMTTKTFSVILQGPGGELVNVVAQAPSGSQDTIVLQVAP